MPLDRRVSLCGAAGATVGFEEPLKNFIPLSELDADERAAHLRKQPTISYEDAAPAFPASF